jgi:hypothetical protein
MQKLKLIFWLYLVAGSAVLTYGDAWGNAHFENWDLVVIFFGLTVILFLLYILYRRYIKKDV